MFQGRSAYSSPGGQGSIVTVFPVRKGNAGQSRTAEGARPTFSSVFGHFRIDAIRPSQDPASQIVHFLESSLLQKRYRFSAAHAGAAMGDDLAARVKLVHTFRQIAQRDQMPFDVADLILVGLAHIEHEKVFACIQTPLELFDLY